MGPQAQTATHMVRSYILTTHTWAEGPGEASLRRASLLLAGDPGSCQRGVFSLRDTTGRAERAPPSGKALLGLSVLLAQPLQVQVSVFPESVSRGSYPIVLLSS